MYDGVQKLCEEMPTDGSVRVLIITGAGEKAFAAAEDLNEFLPLAPVMRRQAAESVNPDDSSTWGRVSRNATCPCGSGKKYKRCHGKVV